MPEAKKLSVLRIKEILEQNSDKNHPLTQNDILYHLDADYGIEMERRSIQRNIDILKSIGMEIEHVRGKTRDLDGYYVEKRFFDDAELRLLIDAVLSSYHVTEQRSKELIQKIESLSNKFFKSHIRHVANISEFNKTENPALFTNIELIDEAINRGRQIRYEYNKYGIDKKLHHSSTSVISPYQLVLHNQRYYVMGYSEYWGNMIYHRLDRITNMTIEEEKLIPIRNFKGYENGVNFKTISCCMPYMYVDTPEFVELLVDNGIIDQIIDWFGRDVIIQKYSDTQVRVRLKVSPMAMENWALQYLNHVEVLKPESLRTKIRDDLEKQIGKYQNK